ncbi:MAG: PH domain-containing protein [Oscillospiraceae bacterium]|nr:PH domain-containing protein [Oscillospiraceae bacterium]
MDNYLWKDRKHIIFGLPWSFTRYYLNKDKLVIDSGLFSRTEEEVRLYRVLDISLRRTLRDRVWGLGTVHLCTADKSTPEINIKRIRHPVKFKEMLSDMVEAKRDEKRIAAREYMASSPFDGDDVYDEADFHS